MGNTQGKSINRKLRALISKLDDTQRPVVRLRTLKQLELLLTNSHVIDAFCNENGIPPLLVLISHSEPTLPLPAVSLLLVLSSNAIARTEIFLSEGVLALIALLRHPSKEMLSTALIALNNLAIDDNVKVDFRQKNGIPSLIDLMMHRIFEVRQPAIALLESLIINEDNKIAIVDQGGMIPLLKRLRDSNSEVRLHAISVIVTLTEYPPNRNLICKASAVNYLMHPLCESKDETLRRMTVVALKNLALAPESWLSFQKDKRIFALVELLRDPDPEVKKQLAGTIANLAMDPSNRKQIELAGATISLNVLRNNGNPELRREVKRALHAINMTGNIFSEPDHSSAQNNIRTAYSFSLPPIITHHCDFIDTESFDLEGDSFCGGIFKRESDESFWNGQCHVLFPEKMAEEDAVMRKIGSDIYAHFGVAVPETLLAKLPIILPKGAQSVTDIGLDAAHTHTVYLLSEIISDFNDFGDRLEFKDKECFYLNLPGHGKLKVVGLGHILAVSCFIHDIAALGDNIAYQISGNEIHCFKINVADVFNNLLDFPEGNKKIRVTTNDDANAVFAFEDLPRSVQVEFIDILTMITDLPDKRINNFFMPRGIDHLMQAGKLQKTPRMLSERKNKLKAMFALELKQGARPSPCFSTLRRGEVTQKDINMTIRRVQRIRKRLPSMSDVANLIPITDLRRGKELGKGSFSRVYQGIWKGSTLVAMKVLISDVSSEAIEELRHEAEIMVRFTHPNIMTLYGICIESENRILILKYMPKGSLYKLLHNTKISLNWPSRWKISRGIAAGLSHLHGVKPYILHRDLKSLNVMMDLDGQPVITDFGLSKVKTETRTTLQAEDSGAGTLAWMAPELFTPPSTYTKASDIYSLSMLFFAIATRKEPWSTLSNPYMIGSMLLSEKRPTIESSKKIPPEYVKLIKYCWAQKPRERPRIAQVIDALGAIQGGKL